MKRKDGRPDWRLMVIGGATMMLVSLPADAQNILEKDNDASKMTVPDIVVTASRRKERLQDVPIAVTALDAKALAGADVNSTISLGQVTPSLGVYRSAGSAQLSIRGVGSRAVTMGDESNIAIYIDGVYQPATYTGTIDLLEIERVEVLRGPQGTLFGRNATGGLVNIITPDPTAKLLGDLTVRYGSFNERSVKGYLTGPLSDKLRFDIAAMYRADDGYIRDLVRGGKTGSDRSVAVRSKLQFEPADTIRFTLSGNYLNFSDPQAVTFQPIGGNSLARNAPGAIVPTVPNTAALSFTPYLKIRQIGTALKGQVELGSINLEETSSYQNNRSLNYSPSDPTSASHAAANSVLRDATFTQEIQFVSDKHTGFKWTAGFFGFSDVGRYDPLTVIAANGTVSSTLYARNLTNALAAFAEGTVSLTNKLKILIGGRYSWEYRHFTATRLAGGVSGSLNQDVTYKAFTPRASLQYAFTPEINAYISYNKGFKSGVYNAAGLNPVPVKPEWLDAYEIGLKTNPARWLRVNMALFHYNYRDIQVTARLPTGLIQLQNAARARINGGELEITVMPMTDLRLTAFGTLLDAKYSSFPQAVVQVPLSTGGNQTNYIDASGNYLFRSPNNTVGMSFEYSHETEFGKIGLSGNIFHSARYYWDFSNRLTQNPYTMANMRIWVSPVHNLQVGFWVDNLTNATVYQTVASSGNGDFGTYLKPRTFGIDANLKF